MKRILITGANKGIGLATVAKLLDSYDETFLLLGSRDSKKGQEAVSYTHLTLPTNREV